MKQGRILIICATAIIVGYVATLFVINYRKENMKDISVEQAYEYQTMYFYLQDKTDLKEVYLPFSEYGRNLLYCQLSYYEQQTGNKLKVDDIKDYLSSEYEKNGSLRLFNNGKHPEIFKYIKWSTEHHYEIYDYIVNIPWWHDQVKKEIGADGDFQNLTYVSLDELIKKSKHIGYEILSLYYEEHGAILE